MKKIITIKNIVAREILDSRGIPTIETKITLNTGHIAMASVASGTSTGIFEAHELRDGDMKRFSGAGVLRAVLNVNKIIAPKLIGFNIYDLKKIDETMLGIDSTVNKNRLGANAILSVSMACARAGAMSSSQELFEYLAMSYGFSMKYKMPTPCFNILNGGVHADSGLDVQEFMLVPLGNKNFFEKVRLGAEVFKELATELKSKKLSIGLGHEGGYAPKLKSNTAAIEMLMTTAKRVGYQAKKDYAIAIDVAASEFYNEKTKTYKLSLDKKNLKADGLITMYQSWLKKYPIISIEDGLAQEDWFGWQDLTKKLSKKIMLVGDDLFVTNIRRIKQGLALGVANATLIKLNQIGTVSETMEAIKLSQDNNYKIMISHRSGETNDDFIADLAVACGAEYIKAGSLARGERLAKYNRLMDIASKI